MKLHYTPKEPGKTNTPTQPGKTGFRRKETTAYLHNTYEARVKWQPGNSSTYQTSSGSSTLVDVYTKPD